MAEKPPIILTIAGFDPSSGAGVTADIKTIAAHACYGVACITALTVQSTSGVRRFEVLDPALVSETLEELAGDVEIAAVHIGMLATGDVVKAVCEFLESRERKSRLLNVVLDPIIKASSGADLLDAAGVKLLKEKLIPLSDVVTPNVDEAAVLTGLKVTDLDGMKAAAAQLQRHVPGKAPAVGRSVARPSPRRWPGAATAPGCRASTAARRLIARSYATKKRVTTPRSTRWTQVRPGPGPGLGATRDSAPLPTEANPKTQQPARSLM